MPKPTNNAADTAELDRLRAELAALKAAAVSGARISYKVSEKGALSVYGLGRFPVTLYAGQWERLLAPATVEGLRSYMADNASRLARKDA